MGKIVIDGNAFYELDEECMKRRKSESVKTSGEDRKDKKQTDTWKKEK